MSTATWGAQLRGVQGDAGAVRPGEGGEPRSTGHSSPVTFEAPATTTSRGPAGAAASASRSRTSASATLPGTGRRTVRRGFHGSSAAWCSDSKTNVVVSRGRLRPSRLSESVVLRVKTTRSSARAPTNAPTSARASSYQPEVTLEA